MNGWLYFWIVTIIVSYVIFFGVAIVVGIKGWKDLHSLFALLQKSSDEGSNETN